MNRRLTFLLALFAAVAPAARAIELPPAAIAYRIDARLDPATRALRGTEEIRWTNTTGATLAALPLHLYLNAFAHQRTTWLSEEQIGRFDTVDDLIARSPTRGAGSRRSRSSTAAAEGERPLSWRFVQPDDGNPLDRSLAEVTLAAPLAPGETVTLAIAFEGRLPYPIARTGGARDFFLIAQWYPKIGVPGAARQFHSTTEFFADFADYDVTFPRPLRLARRGVGPAGRAARSRRPAGSSRTASCSARSTTFALVAGSNLAEATSRHTPKGGGPASTSATCSRGDWRRSSRAAARDRRRARHTQRRGGPLSVRSPDRGFPPSWAQETAGMEYPTFLHRRRRRPRGSALPGRRAALPGGDAGPRVRARVLLRADRDQRAGGGLPRRGVRHLLAGPGDGGALRRRRVVERPARPAAAARRVSAASRSAPAARRSRSRSCALPRGSTPPARSACRSTSGSGRTLTTAERLFGREAIDRVFRAFYRRWVFRHPTFADFVAVAREEAGEPMAAFLTEAFTAARQPDFAVGSVRCRAGRRRSDACRGRPRRSR